MFHSLALIASCALAAMCLGLAQGLGTGSGQESGSAAIKTNKQLSRCRQSCYQQFSKDWHRCTDFVDCRNCWQSCPEQLLPFKLSIHQAQHRGALVLTDVRWDELITNASRQCLITWEVSGGGLMGNLLTDAARAELSLVPDTEYNIQVTCKNKLTGLMRRSQKLKVDTRQLVGTISPSTTTTTTTTQRSMPGRVHPTDRVYIISALPTASQLSGVVYPAFGALAFFLALLVMFLFLRPQRKRLVDPEADTASLLSSRRNSRISMDHNSSTLHV